MRLSKVQRRINPGEGFGFTITFTNLTLRNDHSVSMSLYTNKVTHVLYGDESGTKDFDISRQGLYDNSRSIVFNITSYQSQQLGEGDLFADILIQSSNTLEELRLTALIAKIGAYSNANGCSCIPCSTYLIRPENELCIDVGMFTRVAVAQKPNIDIYPVPDPFYTVPFTGITFNMVRDSFNAYQEGKLFLSNLVNTGRIESVFEEPSYISAKYSFTVFNTSGEYEGYTVQVQAGESGVSTQYKKYKIQTTEL